MSGARKRRLSLQAVVDGGLCSGCGVCAYLQSQAIEMVDVLGHGRRPRARDPESRTLPDGDGAIACPGSGLSCSPPGRDEDVITDLWAGWGRVAALWEGHAADPEIRFAGSSGGVATALGWYAMDACGYEGVLHVGAKSDAPHLNETAVSRSRADLLKRTGSRYAPASPCDGLMEIERGAGPFLFIAKPCDVAAAMNARELRPDLDRNLAMTVAFFCAGTPSTAGTLDLLKRMGVPSPDRLRSLRYRGNGWPGLATANFVGESGQETSAQLTYEESWGGVLTKHVQWRCRLCADHTGEFADISVGDPWYREMTPGEPGSSLIIGRTERGRRFIESAIAAGYLLARPVDPSILPRSQPNLLRARGAVWGRTVALKAIGAHGPRYEGMNLFRFWWQELPLREKVVSLVGTARRCISRGFHPWFPLGKAPDQ